MAGGDGTKRRGAVLIGALAIAFMLAGGLEALARGPVFGVARPEPGFSPADWGALAPAMAQIAQWQGELYRALAALVREFKTNPAAGGLLIAFSFAYGVLHAAGPGHGKAVLSSYLLASGDGVRRGAALSFAAAAIQALSAIALVSILAGLLRATSLEMTRAGLQLEVASYGLIALMGAFLVARKSLALLGQRRRGHAHSHAHDHLHHSGCGHDHAVDAQALSGQDKGMRRAALAVLAVGVRPCSGAILVLVFALAQQVFYVGMVAVAAMALGSGITVAAIAALVLCARDAARRLSARRPRTTGFIVHGVELAGALSVFLFGLVLFLGTFAAL